MAQTVFVYGTLMYPQVLQALINRVPTNAKAVVNGFSRHSIRGQVFPGVIPAAANNTVRNEITHI